MASPWQASCHDGSEAGKKKDRSPMIAPFAAEVTRGARAGSGGIPRGTVGKVLFAARDRRYGVVA